MYNALQVDSLEHQLQVRDQYILNIQSILRGNETISHMQEVDTVSATVEKITFEPEAFDSVLNEDFQEEEKYGISNATYQQPFVEEKIEVNKLHFFCPLRGTVSNSFDSKGNHFGVDIVSNLNEPILSVMGGTVVFSGWTLEAGFIIEVQHNNNLISIYKHNSQLLKKMGDKVVAGEPIAIIGNTGEYTTGPHLHFELWHQGKPLNPRDYIVF